MIALGGVVAAAGTALFGVSYANANVTTFAGGSAELKEIKVRGAIADDKSFFVEVRDVNSQILLDTCVDNPAPDTFTVALGVTANIGDSVFVRTSDATCSLDSPDHNTPATATVPDDQSTEIILDLIR